MARTIVDVISKPKALTPYLFESLCDYIYLEMPIKEKHGFEPIGNGRFSIGTLPFPDTPEGISRVNLVFSPRTAVLGERDDVIEATFWEDGGTNLMFPFSAREFVVLRQINGNKGEDNLFSSLRRFLVDLYRNDGATELERRARRA